MPKGVYRGRTVELNKPFRTPGASRKFAVYVKNNQTGKVNVVRFGEPGMSIKRNTPARRKSFNARMGAVLRKVKGQKNLSAAYWSIRAWDPKSKWV